MDVKRTLIIIFIFQLFPGISQTPHLIIPKGHLQGITSVCFSPDGKFILSGSRDSTAKIWNHFGDEVETFKLDNEVQAVAFSPDGNFILTGCRDGKIKLWKITGELLQSINGHSKCINAVAFSLNGKHILSGSDDHSAKLWDQKGNLIMTYNHAGPVTSVLFSNDGNVFITGSRDKTAVLWNLNGEKLHSFIGHKAAVLHVGLSPDEKYLVTASEDSTTILWNLNGSILQHLKHTEKVISCDFSPDNQKIATGSVDGLIKFWNVSGKELSEFKAHEWGLSAIHFAPDGNSIISGSEDKTLNQFDLKGHRIQHYQGHTHNITSVCFSPDGKYILTGSGDNSAKLWDIFDNNYQSLHGHKGTVISVCFSPDGKFILTGSEDKTAKRWDLNGKELMTYTLPEKIVSVAFSPDGKLVLTACNKTGIKLWDLNGKEILMIRQAGKITAAVFSPNGKSIATAGSDGMVNHCDLSGKLIKSFNVKSPINCLSFTPDGKSIITSSKNGHTQLWNSITGENINTLEKSDTEILSLSVSMDGKWIANGDADGKIALWNLSNNNSKLLISPSSKIFFVNFSPDGKYLLSSSEDETTKIWNCESGRELSTLISLDSIDWVVTNPNGFFDATPQAMEHMDYAVGLEDVELEQLKERYYEPGLLEEVFGLTEDDFGDVSALSTVALYPDVEATINKQELEVHLKARSGGIGKLSVFVDHKEVTEDANPERKTELKIDLNQYNKFYFGDTNVISLIVYNEEEWLESRSHDYIYFPYQGSKGKSSTGNQNAPVEFKGKPHLYALVVGTSNYSGDNLDLKFPDLDAAAIAQGLQAVGSRLFEDRVHIKLLSTSGKTPQEISTKINIENALKEFAEKATPGDVVISYFSGHGTTYGQAEKNQFYYLTKDIASENLSDPEIRKNYTVSSEDLTKWLTAIPAHKEVLIFDACHSGKAIESLATLGARDLSPSQIKALDRMKDRSGIFILSGSAADAVSYEASTYGQGLLTYSLLQGMSGMAVTEDKRVDLANLFEYARDKVPEFAKSINKIQIPVVAFPKGGGSFDIGIVDATVKIPLAQPKPVFIRNVFLDESTISDQLNITHALSEYFRSITSQGAAADLIYVDVNDYENAYSIKGLYNVKENVINLRARLFRGKNSVGEFQLSGDKSNIEGLIAHIAEKVSMLIQK